MSEEAMQELNPFEFETIKTSWKPWVVCLSGALFFFYALLQMNVFSSISESLMTDFHLSGAQMGWFASIYFIANAAMLLPAGLLLDRFSARWLIIINLTFCAAATALFAVAKQYEIALLARCMIGLSNAFCFLPCMKLISAWFPPRKIALATGGVVTMGMLGGVCAQKLLEWGKNFGPSGLGWRELMLSDALLGVIFVVLVALLVRDNPNHENKRAQRTQKPGQNAGFMRSLLQAFSNFQNWLAGIYTCLMNLPLALLGGLWGELYLKQGHHLSLEQASNITSMLFLGTIIGSPLVGALSDRLALRTKPMQIGALLSLLLALPLFYYLPLSYAQLLILCFLMGLVSSTQVLSYPLVAESNPENILSVSMGINSTFIMGGSALFQWLTGFLLDMNWSGKLEEGHPLYQYNDYQMALSLITIGFIVAWIVAVLARETFAASIINEKSTQ